MVSIVLGVSNERMNSIVALTTFFTLVSENRNGIQTSSIDVIVVIWPNTYITKIRDSFTAAKARQMFLKPHKNTKAPVFYLKKKIERDTHTHAPRREEKRVVSDARRQQ